MRIPRSFLSAAVLTACAGAAPAQQILQLPELPGAGSTYVAALSADGTTVVGYAQITDRFRAFRWTPGGGLRELAPVSDHRNSFALGVSGNGSIVAGMSQPLGAGTHAVRWDASGAVMGLGTLPAGGDAGASAVSVNGQVIAGWSGPPNLAHAFRWTSAGGMLDLGTISDLSQASALDATGSVVVGMSGNDTGFGRPLRWTAFGNWQIQNLGVLPGQGFCAATGVSGNGTAVVGNCLGPAFRWTATTGMQPLPMGPFTVLSANAISQDGSTVIGNARIASFEQRAFLWSVATGTVDLNAYLPTVGVDLQGWVLLEAWGVDAGGRVIAGNGTRNGLYRPFVVYLETVPCYANCDGSTAAPVLNVGDFTCFLQLFASGDAAANCDGSAIAPTVNVADLTCFLQRFGAGCQ